MGVCDKGPKLNFTGHQPPSLAVKAARRSDPLKTEVLLEFSIACPACGINSEASIADDAAFPILLQ